MRWFIGSVGALAAVLTGCSAQDDPAPVPTSTSSVAAATAAPPTMPTAAPTAAPTSTPSSADVMETVYVDDEASDRAYWERAVELLQEQDSAVLTPEGDVNIEIVHEGERVVIYRDDLGSIAFNSCLEKVNGADAADTVTWIKDAFEVQRRWEAAQLRTAALETKCPTA